MSKNTVKASVGWEKRGQRTYYYRRVRRNGRLISEYLGNGWDAERAAAEAESRRREQAAERDLRAEWLDVEQRLDEQEHFIRAQTHAALLLAGFHPHRREWRRRR